MNNNFNESERYVKKKRVALFLLIGLYYVTSILILLIPKIRSINFLLGEICSILINIGMFATPIMLIIFIFTLFVYKDSFADRYSVINERMLTVIVISLIIISYTIGRMH